MKREQMCCACRAPWRDAADNREPARMHNIHLELWHSHAQERSTGNYRVSCSKPFASLASILDMNLWGGG